MHPFTTISWWYAQHEQPFYARRYLVGEARALGLEVIDRCNLTVLQEPGQEDLPAFLAAHQARPPSCKRTSLGRACHPAPHVSPVYCWAHSKPAK